MKLWYIRWTLSGRVPLPLSAEHTCVLTDVLVYDIKLLRNEDGYLDLIIEIMLYVTRGGIYLHVSHEA